MTIGVQELIVRWDGDGVTTNFGRPFRTYAASDLRVVYVDEDGGETELVLNSDFTVNGASADVGSIDLIGSYAANPPASGTNIVLISNVPLNQNTDYTQAETTAMEVIEATTDRTTQQVQQVDAKLGLTAKFSEASGVLPENTIIPLFQSGRVLGTDGTKLLWVTGIDPTYVTDATTTVAGIVELATNGEALAQADTEVVITPSNLAAVRTATADVLALTGNKFISAGSLGSALAVNTLTDAATIAVDCADSLTHEVTITAARVLGNPSNAVAGTSGHILVKQDGTGGWALTYDTNWVWAGGTAPTNTTTANAEDMLFFYVISPTKILGAMVNDIQ